MKLDETGSQMTKHVGALEQVSLSKGEYQESIGRLHEQLGNSIAGVGNKLIEESL